VVNTNSSEQESEQIKLSPLGSEEINSVIKSFKDSSFNKEDLYNNEGKSFVKKTLFDLAKESEKKVQIEENEADTTQNELSSEEGEIPLEKKADETKENSDYELSTVVENDTNITDNQSKKNEQNEHEVTSKEENKLNNQVNQNNDNEVEGRDENALIKDTNDINKQEFEEKTLEALDSVREAVTKSLEESVENTDKEAHIEVEDNQEDRSIKNANNVLDEINSLNALFTNIREISTEEIENVIKAKVVELAESVIGYEIEKFPDKFLKKIKNSVAEIKNINNEIKIFLNDEDLNVVNDFNKKNKTEFSFKLYEDINLGRGDFTVDMGGLVHSIKHKKIID
tara:strand:- start:3256 stop:4278 length:1023 start_codon:yes stop_codon:yes gene_type:complete